MGLAPVLAAALVISAVMTFRRSTTALLRWMAGLSALSFCFLASGCGAAWLMGSLQQPYLSAPPAISRPGVIVVLSANASRPLFPGGGAELNGPAWRRLYAGVQLARTHNVPLVYSGKSTSFGSGVPAETDMARASAEQWGIPAQQFWSEERSGNTFESAAAVKTLLSERGVQGPVVLVTSAWHMRRAAASFEKQGIHVIPVVCDARASGAWSIASLWPSVESFADSGTALREWIGIAVYRMRGQL